MRPGALVVAAGLWLAVAQLADPADLALGVAAVAAGVAVASSLRRAIGPAPSPRPRLRRPARLVGGFVRDLGALAGHIARTDPGRWTEQPFPDGLSGGRSSDRALAIAIVSGLPNTIAVSAEDGALHAHELVERPR